MRSKLCLYSGPFPEINSYFEMVDIAAEHGLCYVETINSMEFITPDIEVAKKLRKYADQRNVGFACCSVAANLVDDDRREMIEFTKKFCQIAEILGSPFIHHTIALECGNPDNIVYRKEECFKRGIEAADEICSYAKSLGIKAIYEEQGYVFNGVAGVRRLMDGMSGNSGVVADFGNIMFADEKIEDFIPHFADKIAHVHLKDYLLFDNGASMENGDLYTAQKNILRDCQLGEGVVNFDAAFEELKKAGYKGNFALECVAKGTRSENFLEKNVEFACKYIEKL